MKKIHHFIAAYEAGNSCSRSQLGFHSQQHKNLDYLTTAASTKWLLPAPAFKGLCLKLCLCHSSVFTQKWMWNVLPCQCDQLSPCRELRQAFRLSSRVFSLQSFSLFAQDWAVILQQCYYLCVLTSLSSSKADWRFWYLSEYFFYEWVPKSNWNVSLQIKI